MSNVLAASPAAKTRFMRLKGDDRVVPITVVPAGASGPKPAPDKVAPTGEAQKPRPLAADAHRDAALMADIARARGELAVANVAIAHAAGTADLRKARKAKGKAKRDLDAAEAALAAEQHCELAVPAVRREAIMQNGVVLREAHVEVEGRRVHLMPPLQRLFRRDAITEAEYAAGRRYCDAYEAAGLDLYPVGLGGDGGRSSPQSGNRRIEEATATSHELRMARLCIGKFGCGLLDEIAIGGMSVAAWAERKGESEHVVKGVLRMILIRLSEFWPTYDVRM